MSPIGPQKMPRSEAVELRLIVTLCWWGMSRAASVKPTTLLHSPCTSKQASRCTPTEVKLSTPWCQRYSGRRPTTLVPATKRIKKLISVRSKISNIVSRKMSHWSGCKSMVVSVARQPKLSPILITMVLRMAVISAAMAKVVKRKSTESEIETIMVWLSSALKSLSCVTTSSSIVITKSKRITATVVKSSRSSTSKLLLRTPKEATSLAQMLWNTQISFLLS